MNLLVSSDATVVHLAAVRGKPLDEKTATAAGEAAVDGARPMTKNAYKIPLTQVVVKRALLTLA